MNARTKIGLEILEAAIILGLLGDALLRATPWGLNLVLWIGAFVAATVLLVVRHKREILDRNSLALHGATIVLAGFVAWRDSPILQVLDVLLILTILSILSLSALNVKAHAASLTQYALGAISSGANAVLAPFLLVFDDVKWKEIPRNGWTKHLFSVLRGLAIAAPIMLVFGGLFMAADAVFEGIVKNTFQVDGDVLIGHLFLFGFLTYVCAGYLRGMLFGSLLDNGLINNSAANLTITAPSSVVHDTDETKAAPIAEKVSLIPEFLKLGAIEIGIVLGLINLLFLGFVVIQLRYFFGGMDLVQNTEDFKLAEYARRGFFELVTVAALVLPILLTTHFLLRRDNSLNEKLFRVMALINIGLLFVIMFSAVQRMLLYTGNLGYGMTTMRLYPTAFMLWLALVFVWFGLTVLRGRRELFAWGALWTALLVIGGLHVLNPDNFVVRHNVKLMQENRAFDARYMADELSADAIPALAEALPQMSETDRCLVKHEFVQRLRQEDDQNGVLESDFRSWNYSRRLARRSAQDALFNSQTGFHEADCPHPYSYKHHGF